MARIALPSPNQPLFPQKHPARGRRRERIRSITRRIYQRRRERGSDRRGRKRRAALFLSAGAMGLSTAATFRPPVEPVETGSPLMPGNSESRLEERKHASLLASSDELRQVIMEEEGVRYTVYVGAAGNPTVGVGHLVMPGDGLSVGSRIGEKRVLQFFDKDLKRAERAVQRLVGDLPLTQHEFDALVELTFNVGEGTVLLESPRLAAAVEAGDYDAMGQELDYSYAGGRSFSALTQRSERRAAIFMDADYEIADIAA